MELVRQGWIVGPTDKSYKAYLQRPYSDEEKAARKARWLSTDGIAQAVRTVGQQDGKTAEQIDADLEAEWNERWAGREGETVAKFYFQHLSQEQRDEFIELYNAGRMKIGYPGRFYSLPFFARATQETADHE